MVALLAVARQSSFTKAAEELGVTKSVVSNHVKRLEEFIGARLLERTSRSLRLTEAGERLIPHAEAVLASWQAGIADTRALTGQPSGNLVVSSSDLLGRDLVSHAIARLVAEHPRVSARLVITDRRQHLIDDQVDVAVRMGPLRDSTYLVRRLGTTRDILLGSPDLIDGVGPLRDPDDVAGLPWLRHLALPPTRTMIGAFGQTRDIASCHRNYGHATGIRVGDIVHRHRDRACRIGKGDMDERKDTN